MTTFWRMVDRHDRAMMLELWCGAAGAGAVGLGAGAGAGAG